MRACRELKGRSPRRVALSLPPPAARGLQEIDQPPSSRGVASRRQREAEGRKKRRDLERLGTLAASGGAWPVYNRRAWLSPPQLRRGVAAEMSAAFGLCTLVQLQPADERPVSEHVRGPGGGECTLILAIAFFFAIAKLLLENLCFGFEKRKNAEASAVFCKVLGSDVHQIMK